MRSWTRLVATIAGALLAVAALALTVLGLATHQLYVVSTGSMSPTIPTRSLVVVDPSHYQLGEPITFRHNGAVITHRYIGVNADGTLITKGDANVTPDAFGVSRSDVLGGVVSAKDQLGYWFVYLKNPWGIASLLVTMALLVQVRSLFRETSTPRIGARHATT